MGQYVPFIVLGVVFVAVAYHVNARVHAKIDELVEKLKKGGGS